MNLISPTFFFIEIIITINNVASSLQVDLNQNELEYRALPDNLDWRTEGVITPVYDYTGSPYVAAVVMVETIESLYAIATGNLTRGSIARVIDCCSKSTISYECIKAQGGICTYVDYPMLRNTCDTNACQPFASYDIVDRYNGQDDSALLSLVQKSTLFVGFDGSQKSFTDYEGGIYQETNCSQTSGLYALQLVGYGNSETNEPYWIARNSWGQDWGEKGYIRILRGNNTCGIASNVSQPSVATITTTAMTTTTNFTTTVHSGATDFYVASNKFILVTIFFCLIISSYL